MKILVTLNPEVDLDPYKEILGNMGMEVDTVFPFGVIAGSIDPDKIEDISKLDEVLAVEEDQEATIL